MRISVRAPASTNGSLAGIVKDASIGWYMPPWMSACTIVAAEALIVPIWVFDSMLPPKLTVMLLVPVLSAETAPEATIATATARIRIFMLKPHCNKVQDRGRGSACRLVALPTCMGELCQIIVDNMESVKGASAN